VQRGMNQLSKWAAAGVLLALLLGLGMRFVWPDDIEYKQDEIYSFTRTRNFLAGAADPGSSPWLGMPTSKGFANPGMSLWVFYGLGAVFGTETPPALARGVQACNAAALLLLAAFAWRAFVGREREWWLWAVALAAVNPFAVIFERKIWPPSVLPLLMLLFLMSWRRRSTPWGAVLWGASGAIAGQIHLAGFIYVAAFVLWTISYDRARAAWKWWAAGSMAAALPMLPWLRYMATADHAGEWSGAALLAWWRPFTARFWIDWVTEPFGLGLEYFLGPDFYAFLRHPVVGGFETFGVAVLQAVSILLGLWMLGSAGLRAWNDRAQWREKWKAGQGVFTEAALQAGFLFVGIILTVSCLRFERHYLAVAYPLLMLWTARLGLSFDATGRAAVAGRMLLAALVATNALTCMALLAFIHVNGGAPGGDYSKSYARQLQESGSGISPRGRVSEPGKPD
jgi:hypothetical protein